MHGTSMNAMRDFVNKYKLLEQGKIVMDVGSRDYNGSYRSLFLDNESTYIGVDIEEGPNVDMLYGSDEFSKWAGSVDGILCGQTLEHVTDVPVFMQTLFNTLTPGGVICLIAPSMGPVFHYPIWNGYYTTELMQSIVEDAGFTMRSCIQDTNQPFCDCICIAEKPKERSTRKGKSRGMVNEAE